jgi:sec-independent protein translocase protein TatB
MEILGVGWQELIFIFLIALIVLGPKDMQKAGRTIGRWLNQLVRSDGWKALQQTSRELRKLPTTLMREANLDLQETEQAIRQGLDIDPKRSASSTDLRRAPSNEPENTIRPPSTKPPSQATDKYSSGNESEGHD